MGILQRTWMLEEPAAWKTTQGRVSQALVHVQLAFVNADSGAGALWGGLRVCISNYFFCSRYYTFSSKPLSCHLEVCIPTVYFPGMCECWGRRWGFQGKLIWIIMVSFWTIKIWVIVDSNSFYILQNQTGTKHKMIHYQNQKSTIISFYIFFSPAFPLSNILNNRNYERHIWLDIGVRVSSTCALINEMYLIYPLESLRCK